MSYIFNPFTGNFDSVGGGISTVGAIDSQAPSANALSISGSFIYAQSASALNPGVVNNTTQTLSGDKTLNNALTVNGYLQSTGSATVAGSGAGLGFYGTSPISQPSGDVLTALSNLGLITSPTLSISDIPDLSSVYLALSGGTMSGVISMGNNKITNLANGSASGDGVNYGQLTSLSLGLIWQNSINDPDLVDDSLSTPPVSPVYSITYIIAASPTGLWTGCDGYATWWDGAQWIDLSTGNRLQFGFGTPVQVGDRFGVAMATPGGPAHIGGGLTGLHNYLVTVTGNTPGSFTYSTLAPANNYAVSDLDSGSQHYNNSFTYSSSLTTWVDFAGPSKNNAGSALSYSGNTLNVLYDDSTIGVNLSNQLYVKNSGITNTQLANMANNTVKGNKSGSLGVPTDLVLSDVVETGSSVLTITNGTKSVVTASNLTIQVSQATTSTSGYLSSVDWNTFNNKQAALTFGDLTDAGTDGIAITGGTGAVIGSGTSLSQHVADATHNGYLSSADWNTFSSTSGAAITALTGDITATGPGSVAATLATVATPSTSTKVTFNAKGLVTSGTSAVLASGDFANQGTTTTVLHGNAAGNPSWSAVSLTADVSGILPSANGGTGINNGGTLTYGSNNVTFSTSGTTSLTLPTSGTVVVYNAGDIAPSSAALANNQSSPADVTGLSFAGTVKMARVQYAVVINATSSLYEAGEMLLCNIGGSSWQIALTSVGNSSNVIFSITSAGQVQYTSANYTGFSSASVSFRASAL